MNTHGIFLILGLATSALLGSCAGTGSSASAPATGGSLDSCIANLAARQYQDPVCKLYQRRLLGILPQINNGAGVNTIIPDANGTTALHNACGLGDYELVKALMDMGADSSMRTAKGASVLTCIGNDPGGRISALLKGRGATANDISTGGAPASVAGKSLVINYAGSRTRNGSGAWSANEPYSDPPVTFSAGNTAKTSGDDGHPGHSFVHTYKKTGGNTATVTTRHIDGKHYTTTTLQFNSASSGTASQSGTGIDEETLEDFHFETQGASFTLR